MSESRRTPIPARWPAPSRTSSAAAATELHAIGEQAIHLSVKAIILANVYLQPEGLELSCVPRWEQLNIHGKERTATRFTMDVRQLLESSAEEPSEPAGSGMRASGGFAPPAGVAGD